MNAVLPKLEATRPLRWSKCAITFSSADQLCAATAGALPILCSPVISNVQVTKTLIDGGAGLNILSVDTFDNLQVPYQLQRTKPFSGVTDVSTTSIGQVRLPVTFGERKNCWGSLQKLKIFYASPRSIYGETSNEREGSASSYP